MSEKIKKLPDQLTTSREDLTFTKFNAETDTQEMFTAVHRPENVERFDKGGLYLHNLYPTPGAIEARSSHEDIQLFTARNDQGELVGGAQLWDNDGALELYRWVDADHVKQGIAIAALEGFTNAADVTGATLRSAIKRGNDSEKSIKKAGFRVNNRKSDYREVVYERPPQPIDK